MAAEEDDDYNEAATENLAAKSVYLYADNDDVIHLIIGVPTYIYALQPTF